MVFSMAVDMNWLNKLIYFLDLCVVRALKMTWNKLQVPNNTFLKFFSNQIALVSDLNYKFAERKVIEIQSESLTRLQFAFRIRRLIEMSAVCLPIIWFKRLLASIRFQLVNKMSWCLFVRVFIPQSDELKTNSSKLNPSQKDTADWRHSHTAHTNASNRLVCLSKRTERTHFHKAIN